METKAKFLTDTRVTGLLYLGLAISGAFAFLYAKTNIYVEGDAALTSSNLIEKVALARTGIAMELLLVIMQALAALWFYKIFKNVESFAAIALMVFGVVNAIAILISSVAWVAALNASISGEQAFFVYYLFHLHEVIWLVASLFFGLWLIPMGYLAAKALMPKILAIILVAGGVGYILSVFVLVVLPEQKTLAEVLPMLATIGEFWMIGYLLVKPRLNVE